MAEHEQDIPRYADTVVVGGGTAGAAIAGRLAERSDRSVLLLEAGPDYGPADSGRWPAELLDVRAMATVSHSWNYTSAAKWGAKGLMLERARVIGGCSSHNGAAAVWGHRRDYDGWAELGNPGWDTESLRPLFEEADRKMRVWQPTREQITPFHQATLDAAPAIGIPVAPTLNDFDLDLGIAIHSINSVGTTRWNMAFAYLDPVRDRTSLTIRGNVLVDRVVVEHGRAVGLDVIGPGGPARIQAGQVVVCAGAYGSPLLLQRSGIAAPELLAQLGLGVVHALPGVGENLQDHSAIQTLFPGTPQIIREIIAWEAAGGMLREEGTTIDARSSRCREAFDLHIYPLDSRAAGSWAHVHDDSGWMFSLATGVMAPRSRGTVRPASADPEAQPIIDHAYFTDPDDYDVEALVDGIEIVRQMVAQPVLGSLLQPELRPGPDVRDRAALRDYVRANNTHDYHPVGTCKMGPATDPLAVVDARGKVHGLDGLYVADASIMPLVPRANTNIPVLVVGEKVAALLLQE